MEGYKIQAFLSEWVEKLLLGWLFLFGAWAIVVLTCIMGLVSYYAVTAIF